jgi:hypothetical protein
VGIKGWIKYAENQQLHVNYNHFEAWDVGCPVEVHFCNCSSAIHGRKRNQFNGEFTFQTLQMLLNN